MWSKETPTELGFYWFFGHRSKLDSWDWGEWDKETKDFIKVPKEPGLFFVRATQRTSTGNLVLVIEGHFMDASAEGLWLPCAIPELPKDSPRS